MAKPIRCSRHGRSYTFDLLAIRRALESGTLSAEDRNILERFFPDLLDKVLPEQQKAELRDALKGTDASR